jgi:hypothetical protein
MPCPQKLGLWIAFAGRIGTNDQAAALAKACGAAWVAPRAGDGGLNDPAFKDPEATIRAYHAQGLDVYPWLYSHPNRQTTEIAAFKALIDAGADGVIIDAEMPWSKAKDQAVAYGAALRAALPDAWIADAPWPMIGWHPDYPDQEFATFVDFRMPQAYWPEIGMPREKVCAIMEAQWALAEKSERIVRPICPIGATYKAVTDCTPADVAAFLDHYGANDAPVSLYSLDAASAAVLQLLKERATQ